VDSIYTFHFLLENASKTATVTPDSFLDVEEKWISDRSVVEIQEQ